MKIDLKQRYNNVRIKKRDKQKVAFSILKNIYEPTVIFFGLTNSLATFQAIINNLSRNLIEARNIIAFINDVIVRMEIEEIYNNIIEEVLKIIAKDNLFVKLEKYVWKVRNIGFLEVMIGPDGEEESLRSSRLLVLKSVKNVQKFLVLANYYRQFVKNFIRIVKLLYKIRRKDMKQDWEERQQKAFKELKNIL